MTNLDVISGVELTMSAAILVAVVSVLMGRDGIMRLRVSAAFGAWFVLVVILAATGALQPEHGLGTPGLGLAVAVPIALMWLVLMRVRLLRIALEEAPLAMLAGVHVIRVLGVSFLLLQAIHRLPAPFAPVAGWGDIVAGIASVPVAWLVQRQARGWRAVLMTWNLFGVADLIAAVALGVLSSPGPLRHIFSAPGTGLMTTLPWLLIPGFIVPLLAATHLAIFYRLSRPAGDPVRRLVLPDAVEF